MNSNQNSRKTSFVLGGARSGKSLHAETLAKTQHTASGQLVYLATAQIFDEEMQARIDLHKQRRGPEWVLAEAPVDLLDTLRRFEHPDNVILIDCLSVWMTNLIIGEHDIAAHRDSLIAHLAISISSLIFVASETGLGIVPDNALSRQFRDESGRLNQMVARASDDVFFITAGIAQKIKP
jgi:adenosylcobinamide kinase/adenosylcobinamide-phosphate guanylyltransferase